MAFNLQSTIDSYTAFNANKSLSVPGPHVRPNIIPRIGSNASLISQGSQYIQQKIVERNRTFTPLTPPCDPVSTTLVASVSTLPELSNPWEPGNPCLPKFSQNPRLVAQRMSPPVIFQAPAFQVFCPSAVQQQDRCRIAPNVLFFLPARLARLKRDDCVLHTAVSKSLLAVIRPGSKATSSTPSNPSTPIPPLHLYPTIQYIFSATSG